ncbi:hypothetical protein ACLOJK_035228 [Asimina triloba]
MATRPSSNESWGGLSSGAHVLIFPFPSQGHMIPLLDLVHHLSLRGLSLTVLITPKNLPILSPLLSHNPTIQTLLLPFPTHPSIPPGVENTKDLPNISAFLFMMHAMGGLYHPLLHWFQSHPSPPVAIISDFFLGWTHHLASHLGIPRIVFSPSGALCLSLVHSLWRNMPELADPNDVGQVFDFHEVPNSPKYPWWQLSPIYRSYKEGDPTSEFIRDGYFANMASWGWVLNSFSELEGEYLEHLKRDLRNPRVWAAGPILPAGGDVGSAERGGASSLPAPELMAWLDACPAGSVVYVCFGSQEVLTQRRMDALTDGLDASGARFVLCIKQPTSGHVAAGDYGVLPAEFEALVSGRGLIIKGWAPQVAVLSHRAVGSFLTHCGWNSVLEAIVVGVPMLAWPRSADQFWNAGLLVHDMGVAVHVCEGAGAAPDPAMLARLLSESVREDWKPKGRAKELSRAARAAVKEGGSSFEDLSRLASELEQLSVRLGDENPSA